MPSEPSAIASRALIIGLGCRRGCPAEVLLELIEHSLRVENLDTTAISALASIALKHDEPGLLGVAQQLGLPLILLSAAQLAGFEGQLSHRSQAAFDSTGCWGVAESAALAAVQQSGDHLASLVINRQHNSQATFALAGPLRSIPETP